MSFCQEFCLASSCPYPSQIGRQAFVWHMVQHDAAFTPPPLTPPISLSFPLGPLELLRSVAAMRKQSETRLQTPMMKLI